jgi:hypothetical protein
MLVDSELFFQAIIKPVLLRFSNDPYSLSSKELELLKWYSKTFMQPIELELSRLDKIIYCNIDCKISSLIDLSDEK